MEKQVRITDEKRGIVQVTTYDERWYAKQSTDPVTGLPIYTYVPSVTWVTSKYPKGVEFFKWLAKLGWDESQAVKDAAGSKGSAMHKGAEQLLAGENVKMDAEYADPKTGEIRPLSVDEYYGIMSFADWYRDLCSKHIVEVVASELTVWNDEDNYAGTVDLILKIDGKYVVVDLKSGQNTWPEHELQLSAYKRALDLAGTEIAEIAILQIGYKKNKRGWKYTPMQYKYDLYLAAKLIWQNEDSNVTVHQRDYPLEISLAGLPMLPMEVTEPVITADEVPVEEIKDEVAVEEVPVEKPKRNRKK